MTNYRQGQREPTAAHSRGRLVSDFLTMELHPQDTSSSIEQAADRYNGFNLMVGDGRQLLYFSNREGHQRPLKPGVYGLSNHLLDSPWPKVTSGKSALGAWYSEAVRV